MKFDELIDRPSTASLSRVLDGARLDFIAPFARQGALSRLDPVTHTRVRIITRFPSPQSRGIRRLDNDPRHFIDLIDRLGRSVQIYALPDAHTKLYLNGREVYYGSLNLTMFGFGSKPESLLVSRDRETYNIFDRLFVSYLKDSQRLGRRYLDRLSDLVLSGAADYTVDPESATILRRNSAADDERSFRAWLIQQPGEDAEYIEARFNPAVGYNMTGHTQSALPDIRAFLRENLDLIPVLAREKYRPHAFWRSNPHLRIRFSDFVRARGHNFPAAGGGTWHRKLPASLGGRPGASGVDGGRGSGLIARMLIYLARYALERGF